MCGHDDSVWPRTGGVIRGDLFSSTHSGKAPAPCDAMITGSAEEHTRIIKLQVGLHSHETIQEGRLNKIAQTVDISTSSGFINILRRTAIPLSHSDICFMSPYSSAVNVFSTPGDENDIMPRTAKTLSHADMYFMAVHSYVTILVAAKSKGKGTVYFHSSIRSANRLIFALKALEYISRSAEIQAGSIEGQAVEMGLTTTSLLNAEKFPVSVPNSMFSSQVIVNKSRAQWCSMATKIPIEINDCDSIPKISEDI
ncbi:hypothetical protein Dsin_007713 [Dipteronia sinensis]|uniref:Mechanosensitive ion channel MscS domain-containing protein n=1 Tax=Dipteronia sinensis TaxID=43782 RepID=A0AAE0B134_9ROSI|nr:hypothetical protein Dsin_007713 [Dipteronia sinensis]